MPLPAPQEVTNDEMICRIAYDASNNPEYVGYAAPGSAEGDAAWQIEKNVYTAGLLTSSGFAGGDNSYIHSWTARAGYSYS